MKRLLNLFCLVLLFVGISIPIEVSAAETENMPPYYEFVTEGVEAYYRNKDLGETNDISVYFSKEVLTLLNAKVEMDTFQRQTYGLEYRDYQIDIKPFLEDNWSEVDGNASLTLQVVRTWYYNDDPTTISEVLDVTVMENNGYLMSGCYEKYESITYGPIDEVYQNALKTRSTTSAESVLSGYIADFKELCVEKENQMLEDMQIPVEKDIELLSETSLSRTKIRDWARENFNQDSPTSSTSSVSYYDFSKISGAYDCTNFVSHALLAGGATMHDDGLSGIQGTDQWYYRSTANRSSSWAGVNQLYTFLTRSNPSDTNKGPYATEKDLTYANAFLGDVVQGHNGSTWRHSTVVTKFANSQVYVTGRTAPGSYNDNQLATTIYGTQRLLHLDGNFTG